MSDGNVAFEKGSEVLRIFLIAPRVCRYRSCDALVKPCGRSSVVAEKHAENVNIKR